MLDRIPISTDLEGTRVDSETLRVKLKSELQMAGLLQATERAGAQITRFDTAEQFVVDQRERIAMWEQWLGEAAGATKQRCPHCKAQELRRVPGLIDNACWWCKACSRMVTPVVETADYDHLPLPTAGIARIPSTRRGFPARACSVGRPRVPAQSAT